MRVLTINTGSASVKLAVYEVPAGMEPARMGEARADAGADPAGTLRKLLHGLPGPPDRVAHRVVHGGTRFTGPTLVDDPVFDSIRQLSGLAPLHNPAALKWLAAAREICSGAVHVAQFDTAFFTGLPRVAAEYALPPRIGVDIGVRRYGFHGLAHQSMWRRWCGIYPELPGGGRLVTVQLGGGCSIAAISHGRPADTSMGFSPLEGLVMATRSGTVDPAAVAHIQRCTGMTVEQVIEAMNRDSGLAGLSGVSGDPAALLADASPAARFALDLYCYRIRKYIGAYLAVLGGCDGIVFGGGVGEHVPQIRSSALARMGWAGIELDPEANARARGGDALISRTHSVKVRVVQVDEELTLAHAALAV